MVQVLTDTWQMIEAFGVEKVFLLLMAPVFMVCMGIEAWYLQRRRAQTYSVEQVGTNTVLAASHAAADGLAWALVIALILFAGIAPLFLGLFIALPVLGHASWHMYRHLLPPEDDEG